MPPDTKTRTIDEALAKFKLKKGGVGDGKSMACEASLLNWVAGEESWGDSLVCAHPIIRALIIQHNDNVSTTLEQMTECAKLGVDGAIDTWWVPAEVIVHASMFPTDAEPSIHERLVQMLTRVAEWKATSPKVKPNLGGANLEGAYLEGANLARAYLGGANLARANLARANLEGANLEGAYLGGAYLGGANLEGANLEGANLEGANLEGAYLGGAYLGGANLEGAYLGGANRSLTAPYPAGKWQVIDGYVRPA